MWGTRGPLCHFEPGVWNGRRRNQISGRAFAALLGGAPAFQLEDFLFCFVFFSFVLHPISPFSALPSALNLTVDSEAIPLPGPELQNSKVIIFWQDDDFGLWCERKKPIISAIQHTNGDKVKSQPIHALVFDVIWCEFMTSNRFQPYADNKIVPVRMSAYHLLTYKDSFLESVSFQPLQKHRGLKS